MRQTELLRSGIGLMAGLFLMSCGNPANPPPMKWTTENPSASTGAAKPAPPKAAAPAKPAPGSESSLEALRKGEAPAPGPLKEVYFDFDSAALSETARATLRANADWLKSNAAARAEVEGHCDERGTAEYNMALGARRAQSAMDYLVTLGIAANRLSTISYGEEIPVCKEQNEACWSKNRRVRFVVQSPKGAN